MSTAVATRPAVALPSVTRLSLNRTVLELKSFFRRREAVVFTFSLPVVLLIIFGSIFHGTVGATGVSYRLYFTAGIIASGIMSTTFVNLGISIVLEREDGTLKRLAGTPMPKGAYFAGKALSSLVIAAIEVAILLGIGIALYGLKLPNSAERWVTFTWVFLLGVATCTMLGIAVSSVPRSSRSAAAVSLASPCGSRCAARAGRCRPTPRWCCCVRPRRRSPTCANTPTPPTSGWSCPMSRTWYGSTSATTGPVSTPNG